MNKNKKILSVFAHREDFILFGWPVVQDKSVNHLLYVIVDEAIEIINKICHDENIQFLGDANLENRFSFQLDKMQRKIYEKILNKLKFIIENEKPDMLFTHNPMGEYGHSDHKFLFELIYNNFDLPIIITDILVESSHCVYYKNIPKNCKHFYKKKLYDIEPDLEFYKRNSRLYKAIGMWTKNKKIIEKKYPKKVSLYLVKD